MRIIMNYCESAFDAVISFKAVENAIKDGIKEGRNNYIPYEINEKYVSVHKNKKSFTTYIDNIYVDSGAQQ